MDNIGLIKKSYINNIFLAIDNNINFINLKDIIRRKFLPKK